MTKPVNVYRTISIYLLIISIISIAHTANAEPIYPLVKRDSVDKLLRLINLGKQDSNRVNMLLTLALYYEENGNDSAYLFNDLALELAERVRFKKGLALAHSIKGIQLFNRNDSLKFETEFSKAINICQEENDIATEAFIWYKKGSCYFFASSPLNALLFFDKSKKMYQKAGDFVRAAYIVKCAADMHFRIGQPAIALKSLFEATALYRKAGEKKLHYTYDLMGAIYKSIGNYEDALKYAMQALETSKQTNDTAEIDLFYARIGQIYNELQDYSNATFYLQLALNKCIQLHDVFNIRTMAGHIALIKAKTGKPAEALVFYSNIIKTYPANEADIYKYIDLKINAQLNMYLKKYALAEKNFLELIDISRGNQSMADLIFLAEFYITVKQYGKAKNFLNRALQMVSVNSSYQLPQIHQLYFKVDSAAGEYVSAIQHYQISKAISDSIFNEKKINQIASLQIKFDTEKKDQSIALLTSEKKEQSAILKQRVFQRNMMIVGAAILLCLVWFIYNRYQLKNKTALQLEEQKKIIDKKNEKLEQLLSEKEDLIASKSELITEKEWLLKEVHHRVKNNLQMVMTLLYTQSAYLKDQQALDAITESQHRIHAISLIHQKLYQSDNLQLINMNGYIHELVDNLKESFDKEDAVEITLNIQPLELDVSKSIPIGLMLNEAVTNALKYAFKNVEKKVITISLLREVSQQFVLTIRDNGKGLPAGFDPRQAKTLGLRLMEGLCKQIKAKYSIENDHGVCIAIRFSDTIYTEPEQYNSEFENI